MSQFEELWQQLVRKKPDLASPRATVAIDAENLRCLCEQFFEAGVKNGQRVHDLLKGALWYS